MSNPVGAPLGSANNLIHGKRTERHGMVLANLGEKYPAIYRDIRHLRKVLERHKANPDKTIPVAIAARINQACRWELTARIAQWMVAHDNLGPAEKLNALNTMTNATRQRDSLIARLGLNGEPAAEPPDAGELYVADPGDLPKTGKSEEDTKPDAPQKSGDCTSACDNEI